MTAQIPLAASAVAGTPGPAGVVTIAAATAYLRTMIVNVAFLGEGNRWLLVDAGMPGSRGAIMAGAAARFGAAPPRAIVLTHGHFDHVGALKTLAEHWDVPVYAHRDEHPFLDGTRPYPPPEPRLSDGLMSFASPLFPRRPIDLGRRLRALPEDGTLPDLPEWRWLATPGHSPGHVSFFREEGRVLVAGDAFVTAEQEALWGALAQPPEMHGPPRYFTPDWAAAERSVAALAALRPEVAVTGHGKAIQGAPLREALDRLARDFRAIAVPR